MTNGNQQGGEVIAQISHWLPSRVARAINSVAGVFPEALEKHRASINWGDSRKFAIYLLCLASRDAEESSLIERFETAYVGTYSSKQALMARAGHLLGSGLDLTESERAELANVDIETLPDWANAKVWARFHTAFYVVTIGRRIHVFRKDC